MKPRIAIVVQRYGRDINGGAELHARLLANALGTRYQVDVLTSRAHDYQTWAPELPAGEEWIDGVRVLRFDHPARNRRDKRHLPLRHKLRWVLRRWIERPGRPLTARPSGRDTPDGLAYLCGAGPTMDGLMDHLRQHGGDYAALIFFTARFHPAAMGVLLHPQRSLLLPTLHHEKTMVLPHFHRVFRAPHRILWNTPAEAEAAQRLYGDDLAPGVLCGVGITVRDAPDAVEAAVRAQRFDALATQHGIRSPYLVYVGRVDTSKGCDRLFAHFAALRAAQPAGQALQLLVCGQWFMPPPTHPDIVATGFVSEADRDLLIARAEALVIPSQHESLSMVLLEALAEGCAVIVNRRCEVLLRHVHDSGVGEAFDDGASFNAAVQRTLARDAATRADQAARGRRYVRERYDWQRIVERIGEAIDSIPPA